ncbi:MAG: Hsp20/alpha crystallin family protein, partial [Phycisphaerae bacterium]
MAFRPWQDKDFSLGNLQEEMNRMFDRVWHSGVRAGPFDGQQWAPPVDLYEHDDRYVLYIEIPGVDGNEVEVTHVGSALTIKGEKVRPDGAGEGDRPLRGERCFGTFCRTIELPGDIQVDKLSAKCHGGVLEITVPKSEASRPKAVKI